MGALALEKALKKVDQRVTANVADTIFHVFSEDFVHEELREHEYDIDGKIENQISVDSENIKLKDAQDALGKAHKDEQTAITALRDKFELEKLAQLHEKSGINKQLKEYRALNIEDLLLRKIERPNPPTQSFADILKDLDSLKAVPAEPLCPDAVNLVRDDDIELTVLASSLQKVTSPSSVSEEIKKKIDAHHGFYEAGIKILQEDHRSTCPFCEQGIFDGNPKAIIDAYVDYFAGAEEKHKSELRDYSCKLNQKEGEFQEVERQLARQKLRHDGLKRFVPSQKDTEAYTGEAQLKDAFDAIAAIKDVIQRKAGALPTAIVMPGKDLSACISAINRIIGDNNVKSAELTKAVEKSDEERKALQRKACAVLECEFAIANWTDIEALGAVREVVKAKELGLTNLERSSPSTDARVRVAETFELLLKEFFVDKYVFDKKMFTLKRGNHEMTRGAHRTLSDGEKTAIAFCYFIACMHRKVTVSGDYRKLYFVFDDPVTSMSYDYVFAIAQALKNLSISNQGEVSINPGKIDGNKWQRPELLILTHSSYFFNISRTNAVVKKDATFLLHRDGATHRLAPLDKYVAPFEQQLEQVFNVANGSDPDQGTGNAIRSILEAIGRFCRPDKSQSLQDFITFLAGEENISIKSVLINSLCHGTYYDEAPPPDDLTLACQEAIVVVERYAPGQLELIKGRGIAYEADTPP